MHSSDPASQRAAIRRTMRARRADLDATDRDAASMSVFLRLARLDLVRGASVLAGYRAVRGEVDVGAVMELVGDGGGVVTTPRVSGEHLDFIVTTSATTMVPGAFGIPEPAEGSSIPVAGHDVVLVPLVAFDRLGRRLGHGGGYYDRALENVSGQELGDRPTLIGVAHSFQELDRIPPEPWDVPLDAVVTEEETIGITPGALDRAV